MSKNTEMVEDAPCNTPWRRERGPVWALCEEIGFEFDAQLERPDVLIAFVRQLVGEIAQQRYIAEKLSELGGKAPSASSADVLALAERMVGAEPTAAMALAADLHDMADLLNPDEAYPTDHLIDMLSSCASAIRFGLETPCRSRHAAEAANHVWRITYGVSRGDRHSRDWSKAWARSVLLRALVSMLPPSKAGDQP